MVLKMVNSKYIEKIGSQLRKAGINITPAEIKAPVWAPLRENRDTENRDTVSSFSGAQTFLGTTEFM